MSIIKNIFGKKEEPMQSVEAFWAWFQYNERDFFTTLKQNQNVEKNFFNKLMPKLQELREGYFFLAGMCDPNTAELVLTADGDPRTVPFVEDLVSAAPALLHWKFTALKQPFAGDDMSIDMEGYRFNTGTIGFYAKDQEAYPDEIDLVFTHDGLTPDNRAGIQNGVLLFLDNYLGEADFLTIIDNVEIIATKQAQKDVIPVSKLKAFLTWKQKEFLEKYEAVRYDTGNDRYVMLEAELPDKKPLLAIVNADLLEWDGKVSHPWIVSIEMKYDGRSNNGMPDKAALQRMENVEAEIAGELRASDGYLNIGRQTADGVRTVYFACRDFRVPARIVDGIRRKSAARISIEYHIYKDKYWRSFERFSSR